MSKKIADINHARQKKKPQRSARALAEIKKHAEKEREAFRKISKDEPSNLVSGDLHKIIRGDEDDE